MEKVNGCDGRQIIWSKCNYLLDIDVDIGIWCRKRNKNSDCTLIFTLIRNIPKRKTCWTTQLSSNLSLSNACNKKRKIQDCVFSTLKTQPITQINFQALRITFNNIRKFREEKFQKTEPHLTASNMHLYFHRRPAFALEGLGWDLS